MNYAIKYGGERQQQVAAYDHHARITRRINHFIVRCMLAAGIVIVLSASFTA